MAAGHRLLKELHDLRDSWVPSLFDIQVEETNLLTWEGLIVPNNPPYNKGAFRILINFPPEYPFKPPTLIFRTKIYHPNVDEEGKVCLTIIDEQHWKPTTKVDQIINAIISIIDIPEPEHALRPEIAEEMVKDKRKFLKTAEEFTKKYSEIRPSELMDIS